MNTKFYHIRIGNSDIRVKGSSYAAARRAAQNGKGRLVGAYYDVIESAAVRRLRAHEERAR